MSAQFTEKKIMKDGVEGLGEVKQHKQSNHPLIDGQPDIVCKLDECGLCAVAPAKTSLERIEDMERREVRGELIIDVHSRTFER